MLRCPFLAHGLIPTKKAAQLLPPLTKKKKLKNQITVAATSFGGAGAGSLSRKHLSITEEKGKDQMVKGI